MKIYITSRFKNAAENKEDIETLCKAVRDAGMEDFHFIRDIEQYNPNFFTTQREVWQKSRETLKNCDALLIDVSDSPTGGRVVEAGMAYALEKPIYVIAKKGTVYKSLYEGIASEIFEYEDIKDITDLLKSQ